METRKEAEATWGSDDAMDSEGDNWESSHEGQVAVEWQIEH